MYEASFGLKRRPFAATPDATCFLAAGPIQAALDEIVVCVQQGQGIAVLTAPAGTGKTLLCERLRLELDERYETVFLRHASFLTRRALLQTILCELSHAYHHPSEQELRLELFPAIRALQPKREALVLICDEAHQLSDSLLEELRILADFAEAGQPLVRLVLVGQHTLEEKLAQPGLEAFNQRIRAHLNLNTFDHAESLDYLDYRITWAGGRTDELFTPEALDMVARASDGVPRCMNQLADHSLLLAYVAEQHPVSVELVREALNDLRQLPLHWNEPASLHSFSSSEKTHGVDVSHSANDHESPDASYSYEEGKSYSFEPEPTTSHQSTESVSFEIGAPETFASNDVSSIGRMEIGTDDWRRTIESFAPHRPESTLVEAMKGLLPEPTPVVEDEATRSKLSRRIEFHELLHDAYAAASEKSGSDVDHHFKDVFVSGSPSSTNIAPNAVPLTETAHSTPSDDFHEEIVVDRYTSIDAGFEPPVISVPDTHRVTGVHVNSLETRVEPQPPKGNPPSFVESTDASLESIPVDQIVDLRKHRDSSSFESIIAALNIGEPNEDSADAPESIDEPPAQSFRFDRNREAAQSAPEHQTIPLTDDVDGVARGVYSLGESLRTTGSLSSSADSILKSIHSEIGDSYAVEMDFVPQPPPVPEQTTWEAVETPQVAQQGTESRPFRYLFSMLRRKQKGL